MPIEDIGFNFDTDRDMHVLRGQTVPPLRRPEAVWVKPVGAAADWLSAYTATDLTVEFRPTFRFSSNATEYHGFGIRVDRHTGEVKTGPTPAGTERIDNFLIEIVVLRNDGGKAPGTFEPLTVRVHLHQSVQSFWLTPARMTVRRRTPATAAAPEQTAFRFTARAEFDDGTVGDVTLHHGVRWTPAGLFAPHPTPAGAAQASRVGQILLPTGLGPPAGTTITATLPAALGGASSTAVFTVQPPWSEPGQVPRAELFSPASVSTAAGPAPPEHLPNVLIVPSGYLTGDLPTFDTHTADLLHRLRMDPLSKPFDRLSSAINFWRVPLPSPERAISVRTEVVLEGAPPEARVMAYVARPRDGGPLTLHNLLYLSGVAMSADVSLPVKTLRERWAKTWPNGAALAANDPWPTGRLLNPLDEKQVPTENIEFWQGFGHRTFVDEVDTALPAAVGEPKAGLNSTLITLHPDRGGEPLLADFLAAIEAANGMTLSVPTPGTRIGALWASDQSRFRFNNFGLVTLLCATELGRKQATDRIMLSLNGKEWGHVTPVAGRNAVRELNPIAPVVPANLTRVFVHELAHRFGLGDEYIEHIAAFTGPESAFSDYGNITSLSAVRLDDHFRSYLVKWNWERARAAGVLASALTGSGTSFTATLLPRHVRAFKPQDEVRLRPRSTKVPLGYIADPGPVFEVVTITGDVVTLKKKVAGAPFNPALIVTGSVIYALVPAPITPPPSYPYLRLIAPVIAQLIDDKNAPLTPLSLTAAEVYAANEKTAGMYLPPPIKFGGFFGTWTHRLDARIVGLYESGGLWAKNTFHPTGACKMRSSRNEHWTFCPVCRYVLVEFIDPSAHGAIDAEYSTQYPTKL